MSDIKFGISNEKEIMMRKLLRQSIMQCATINLNDTLTNFENWDDFLMENFGATLQDVNDVGVELDDLWKMNGII